MELITNRWPDFISFFFHMYGNWAKVMAGGAHIDYLDDGARGTEQQVWEKENCFASYILAGK